jgi:hydroxymethylpyrimidine/phosphomethylpyrimidine kinase
MSNKNKRGARPAPPGALTIAGSDSCGGAGIQADLKSFSAWGVEGASVITAVTAQNTLGVTGAEALPADFVAAQLSAVLDDLPVGAAKTGMLANAGIIEAVAESLSGHSGLQLVVDTVMVATSGARLLDREAERVLIERLLPHATLVTPNLPEAAVLTGLPADTAPCRMADALLAKGCRAVLLKGGHGKDEEVVDWLVTGSGQERFRHRRVEGRVHGTGCALSAAITAGLARGRSLEDSVGPAIEWLQTLIAATWRPDKGELGMLPFADRSLDPGR